MPKGCSLRRRAQAQYEEDVAVLEVIKKLPDYAPTDPQYSVEALEAMFEHTEEARRAAEEATNEWEALQHEMWALHMGMLAIRTYGTMVYGLTSRQVEQICFKTKEQRRVPVRRIARRTAPDRDREHV